MTTVCLAPNGMNVFHNAARPERLLVGTARGVSVLERKPDADWHVMGAALEGMHVSSMLTDPVAGGIYAGIHRGGVWFSGDAGRTWESRSAGIGIEHVYSLGCAIEDGAPVVYAGTEPPGVFRTRDTGRTWDELPGWHAMPGMDKWMFPMPPKIPHTKCLTGDPRDPRVLYAGIEQAGVFKTVDGGRTWRELDAYSRPDDESYRDIHKIVVRPNHPDDIFMTTGMGLYRSTDAGETWTHLTPAHGFRVGYPDMLIFSPHDDRTIFMCGAFSNPGTWIALHTANPAVLVSTDLGLSWTPASTGMPDAMVANIEALSLGVWPGGFSLFAGCTDGSVYCSDDGARNWRCIARDLAPVSKVEHYRLLLPGAVSSRAKAAQTQALR